MLFHLFSFTIVSAILGVSGMKDKLLLVPALEGCSPWGSEEADSTECACVWVHTQVKT